MISKIKFFFLVSACRRESASAFFLLVARKAQRRIHGSNVRKGLANLEKGGQIRGKLMENKWKKIRHVSEALLTSCFGERLDKQCLSKEHAINQLKEHVEQSGR